jgi:phosphoserine/homoserine phosphotransferase
MSAITGVIGGLEPLDGARTFMARLRREAQVIILSDTFLQFWEPMAPNLDHPTIFCNTLVVEDDLVVDYRMRIDDGKRRSVEAFRDLGFRTTAAGDSFNDISMLRAADRGILFRPSPQVISAHGDLAVTDTYEALLDRILAPPAARG